MQTTLPCQKGLPFVSIYTTKRYVRPAARSCEYRPTRSCLRMSAEKKEDDGKDESEITSSSIEFAGNPGSPLDWGGAYGSLRRRISDVEEGKSGPAYMLFRMMARETPNEAIASLVNDANPEVITAMTGAVSSLLGGLSNPSIGMDTVVKATGEKLSALCFQLQMTGYMFRNAEYIVALKDIMEIRSASIKDYKEAFKRLDKDDSGFIEAGEIEDLLADVYGTEPPAFEVQSFIKFFDRNNDNRVSWKEFERGLGFMGNDKAANAVGRNMLALPGNAPATSVDEENDAPTMESNISGTYSLY